MPVITARKSCDLRTMFLSQTLTTMVEISIPLGHDPLDNSLRVLTTIVPVDQSGRGVVRSLFLNALEANYRAPPGKASLSFLRGRQLCRRLEHVRQNCRRKLFSGCAAV